MNGTLILLGSERSGTNLLRSLLDAHPDVFFPHTPGLLGTFEPLEDAYDSVDAFAVDVVGLLRFNHDPWAWIPSEEAVAAAIEAPDIFATKAAIYALAAARAGARFAGIKNVDLATSTAEIARCFPSPRYIWLYRDPRDIAASWLRINTGPKHVYVAARRWRDEQRAVEAAAIDPAPVPMRYEALIEAPQREMRRLCAALGLEFRPEMLDFHTRPQAARSARLHQAWQNLSRPVMHDNAHRHRRDLTAEQIEIVERLCADDMRRLGYAPTHDARQCERGEFTPDEVATFEAADREGRRSNLARSERNYRKERKDRYRADLRRKFGR